MNLTADIGEFHRRLDNFSPDENILSRTLSMYAAAIAFADESSSKIILGKSKQLLVPSEYLYEIMLQSYLFLGFPRMLIAAEFLDKYNPVNPGQVSLNPITEDEANSWFKRGMNLCNLVYTDKFDSLKNKVEKIAPEIFRWMVVEGYGKVLSRDQLGIIDRELAIVAILTVENKYKQLYSHIKGSLNVGASLAMVRQVVEDISISAGDGYKSACSIIDELN